MWSKSTREKNTVMYYELRNSKELLEIQQKTPTTSSSLSGKKMPTNQNVGKKYILKVYTS